MIIFEKIIPALLVSLLLLLGCEAVFAQGKSTTSHSRIYGIGQPKTTRDLPPGQLRHELDKMPAKARGKALGWLRGFSFPAEDIKHLRVSSDGSINYADTFLPSDPMGTSDQTLEASAAADASQVFHLHSKPGSGNVVYLDFDGHTIEGTAWNKGKNVFVALPFDPSENDSPATVANFSQEEMNRIFEIWHRVAEDFAPFDIDITTEEPSVFTSTTGHVLFTHDTDANGQSMPAQNAGGTAFVNSFGASDYVSRYSPALVYYTNLYTSMHGSPVLNAEAASHEFGHNLGLSHDGETDGSSYYSGHGSGLVDWSPIMGNSYSRNVTQWSQGGYPGANNPEDDLAIIASMLGYVGDDHGDSPALATALLVQDNGEILVSSPELDPENILPENKGVIDDRNDVDWFFLDAAAGELRITATPAWHSFPRNDLRGSNLDIELTLFNANLELMDNDEPNDDTDATVLASVPAGRYYLQVDGAGNDSNSEYDDYASIGMYFLEGSIAPIRVDVDRTPPSPATMSWQTAPYAMDTSSISMTATGATDESGGIEYDFICVAGGSGCTDSGWQSDHNHTAYGLAPGASYSYKVRARDAVGNMNEFSSTLAATTEPEPEEDKCSNSLELAAKQWIVFSLPCDPSPLNSVGDIFSVLSVSEYNLDWALWTLDANGETYTKLDLDSEISPGQAYWLYTYTEGKTIMVSGKNIAATDIPLAANANTGRANFVGNTSNSQISLADVLLLDEHGNIHTRPAADPMETDHHAGTHACDLTPAGSNCLAHRVIRRWTGSNFDLYEAGTPGDTGSLGPFDGFWVDVYRPGARLRLPDGNSAASAAPASGRDTGPGRGNDKAKGNPHQPWHINLVAQSGKFVDSTNAFGQLEDSEEGQDSHDLIEPRPFGNPYMSLLFTNPEFEPVDWGHTSDFRGLGNSPHREWTFVVKASAGISEVTLNWTGDLALHGDARLRDEQTGTLVNLLPGSSYSFTMVNGENHFTLLMQ